LFRFLPQIGRTSDPPGAYQLVVTTPEGTEVRTVPGSVNPGRVSRFVVNLGSRPRGPMIRAERVHTPAGAATEASPLELWRQREPLADDLQPEVP
jgi:hypothetical protein